MSQQEKEWTIAMSDYRIESFGAVADGKTINTKMIQAAVDACAKAGGGRVVVPAGVFMTGAIFLKSRVELHLEAGAVLRGVQDAAAFPKIHLQMRGYDIRHMHASLITAIGETDIAITGCGTLDGQGAIWWKEHAEKTRAPLVAINGCERVLMRDVRAMNSPEWTLRFLLSRDITVDRVKVENPWNHYYNNDGINMVSCCDVRVTNCFVDTGDDGITLKSIPSYHLNSTDGKVDFRMPRIPCENILVSDCIVRHAHGGVVIGSETVGGVRDVLVSNCVFEGTRSGIKIKGSIWGGFVRNVRVSGVIMKRVETALQVLSREGAEHVKPEAEIPSVKVEDIHFSNISMTQCSWAVDAQGRPDAWLRNLSFRNLQMDADAGMKLLRAANVVVDDVMLSCRGIALEACEVTGLEVRRFVALTVTPELPVLQFEGVREAFVHDCTAAQGAAVFLGLVGKENEVEQSGNRLAGARAQVPVKPLSSWNSCSHAFSGCRWIRDLGTRNAWLPVSAAVDRFVRDRWTPEQVDGILSVSRVEANARDGAEVEGGTDPRRIYMIESRVMAERLVVFEDGELLRTVEDPDFHPHYEVRQKDFDLSRIDALKAGKGRDERVMSRELRVCVTEEKFPPALFRLDRPVQAGELIRISAAGPTMLDSLRINRVYADGAPEISFEVVHRYTRAEMEQDWNWYISTGSMVVVRVPAVCPAGSHFVVEAGSRQQQAGGGNSPLDEVARYSGIVWTLAAGSVTEARALQAAPVAAPVDLRLMAGPAARVEAWLKPDGTVRACQFDAFGNPLGASEVFRPDAGSVDNTGRVTLTSPFGAVRTNARPECLDGTPLWFGEFHWHTDFSSDGQRPLADALASARDELGLDFAGPGDHLWASGGYGRKGPKDQAQICCTFDEPGRFCTIAGAELSRRYGHANLYALDFDTFCGIVDRFPGELQPAWAKEPDRYGLDALIRLCVPGKSLLIPHHSNMDSFVRERVVHADGRPYWCALHFPLPADRAILRLFEMVQSRGAFESEEADEDWRIYDGGLGGSARTALTRGYRIGFVAGTDNHCGWPTRGLGGLYTGITVVQAPVLDTRSIFNALHARRCYATSGARMVADITLNGHPMGSEIVQEPGAERLFRIRVRGTAPLTHVQLIHLGYVLKEFELAPDSPDFDAEWADTRPGRPLEDAWYYLRIRQRDGHCAWLSPFWIDYADRRRAAGSAEG